MKIVVVFIVSFLFILLFSFIEMSTLEDSIWLKPAIDIAQGRILFRETFTPYGMVAPFLQSFSVKLFGQYLYVLRAQTALFYALTISVLAIVWSHFMSWGLVFASLLLWFALSPFYTVPLLPWSSVYALFFQSLSLLTLLFLIRGKNRWYGFAAGACIALTFLSRQPVGVFMFGAVLAYYAIMFFYSGKKAKELKELFFVTAGFLLAFIPFIVYLFINQAVIDWWIQSFIFAQKYASVIRGISVDQVLKSLFIARYIKNHTFHLNIIWLLIPLSSVYMTVKSLYALHKARDVSLKNKTLLMSGLICLASWMQYYPAVDPIHFFWAATPLIGFFVYTVHDAFITKRTNTLFSYGLICVALFAIVIMTYASRPRLASAKAESATLPFLRFIHMSSYDRDLIDSFHAALTDAMRSNDTYINLSDDAMIPLLDKRFHTIGPLYEQWNFFAHEIYTDFPKQVKTYIEVYKPVIVTRTMPYFKNYCAVRDIVYPQPGMDIHVPYSRLFECKKTDGGMLILAHDDLAIHSIRYMNPSSHPFSVEDINKLTLRSYDAKGALPKTIKKDTEIYVPSPMNSDFIPQKHLLVLTLENTEFDTCTLSYTESCGDAIIIHQ